MCRDAAPMAAAIVATPMMITVAVPNSGKNKTAGQRKAHAKKESDLRSCHGFGRPPESLDQRR